MTRIPYPKLLSTLEQEPPGGVFFFYGEEEHLREEAILRTVEAHLEPASRDFNLDQIRGSDVAADDLASLVATPPMMAQWRVIVVREAQGLSAKARELMEAAAKAPPSDLALILSCAIPSGSRAKFYSNLQKEAIAVEFAAIDPNDMPGWVITTAADLFGLEMDLDGARALATAVGPNLGLATAELSKLAAYVQERKNLTLEDVTAVVGSVAKVDRWQWFDQVAERRFGDALRDLPTLLHAGESGVGLIIGMSAQLIRIGLVCAGGSAALERELKPYQRWMARKVGPLARLWSSSEIDLALTELLRTDRLLKTASLTDRQAMEELLLRLQVIGSKRSAA